MKLDKMVATSDNILNKSSGASLFAQQVASSGLSCKRDSNNDFKGKVVISHPYTRNWSRSTILTKSTLLTDKDKNDIHEASIAILDSKSDEELKREKDDILANNPNIVQYLMKKSRKASKRPSEAMEQDDDSNDKGNLSSEIGELYLWNWYLNCPK